ncbi:protein translocase subunit SecD [Granulicella sp. 5B5]|uniref:protein translocase subunit SecD n=1 Tax=Granulicella sp. 5B5 TaxID=1617967 RepID=UPI0015F494C8|nr:protein translocase subunit SecD [Granulicella sp. 5B5]QMV18710.1 protein translocase subunit SecD [Granulicella sp. 5B5]
MGSNKLAGRIGFIVAVLVIFVYGIFGIPHGGFKQSLTDRIHLGLDLRGGIHLVLQVHVAEAINTATDRDVQSLNTALATAGATATKLDPLHPEVITVTGVSATQQSGVHDILNGSAYSGYDVSSATGGYTLTMKQAAIRDLESRTLEQSIETIRERVDKLGVSEPVIEQYGLGDNQILVEIPGVSNADRVESIIQSTAKLEIHAVVNSYSDMQSAMTALNGVVPPDQVLMKGSNGAGGADEVYLLKRLAIVEGTDFRDAQPSTDENGRPDITFNLTTEAGDRFYKYTDDNKGSMMAIVLDNQVREAATIQSAIRDQGRITGGFSQDQAQDLSLMLRTGSLPASISYLETRTVGPSLGAESIHQGVVAAIAGMLAVMVFMLIYYRGAGINADIALFLNLVILLGFMGFSSAVLTLPGIAGVILTIGMGVDSNVLIFERIREELHLGKTAAAAIQDGFGHAWITILDTHVTTVVSAGILFIFGTGPVQGFAVTLVFGLLANIFTAVFVSRTIFDYLLSKKARGAALSI